ncbi:hypothetical protein ACV6DQ_00260 [Enterococcus hirae]
MNEKTIDLLIILFFTLVIVSKNYVIFGLLFAIAMLVLCVLASRKRGNMNELANLDNYLTDPDYAKPPYEAPIDEEDEDE